MTRGPILVIDTATTRAVIALGEAGGTIVEQRSWTAGYRHGEELLARVERLLDDRGIDRAALGGVVVGTGPGAFTGLRVGIATAKGLAYALGLPIAGVSTGRALLAAAAAAAAGASTATGATGAGFMLAQPAGFMLAQPAGFVLVQPAGFVLVQPAGPSDRVVSRPGIAPAILPGGDDPAPAHGELLVAVDLAGRAPGDAIALGEVAMEGLAAALLAAGWARIEAGGDDLARLVPEYVTLPRGVGAAPPDGGVELSGGTTA